MEKNLYVLKKASLFAGMRNDEILSFIDKSSYTARKYAAKDYILRSGDTTHSIGIVLSGDILIVKEDVWGNRNIMAKLPAGSMFAETFVCAGGVPLNVSVISEGDSEILFIDMSPVLFEGSQPLPGREKIIKNLIGDLAQKNLRVNAKVTHMSRKSTREKLLSFLSSESERQGSLEFDIIFDRQQLADFLGVDRSAMSSELSKLKNDGLISYNKNHFVLLK